MKSIIKNIAGFICVIIGLNSCENINDVHEEYLKRGEEIYTGVVDSLEAYPGNERIKVRISLFRKVETYLEP